MPRDGRQESYSSQTFAQSTPLSGGNMVVPETYSGHPTPPGASGRQVGGSGTMGGGPPSEGTDEASSGPARRAGAEDLGVSAEAFTGRTAALNLEAVAGAGSDDACDSPV